MFIQNSNGNLKIKIDTSEANEDRVLDGAEVLVKIKRRNHEVTKEAIIVNMDEQIALCYFDAEDLCYPGNYDYQVIVTTKEKYTIKSALSSFYVSPSIR